MRVTTKVAGLEHRVVQLFAETFTASEGADEGTLIGTLASELINATLPEDR